MNALKTLSLAVVLLSFVSINSANALNFLINAETGSPNNRQSFDVNNDRWLLDLHDFPVSGPLTFANAAGGNPGLINTALDDPTTFASKANVIVLQNFDDNDTDGFPANWDNSFNARKALGAIANNTDGDRPGFYLYWNEKLGVNRLVYTDNLNDGTAGFQVLFAANSENLKANTDDLSDPTTTFRGEANANFNTLKSFTAGNFAAVPEPGTISLLTFGLLGIITVHSRRRRR